MDDLNRSAGVGDAYLGNLGNQVQLPILDIDGDATNSIAARINDIFNLVSEHSRQLERVATLIEHQDRTIAALSDKLVCVDFWQICIYYFTTRCQNPPTPKEYILYIKLSENYK